ncbi:hypothetical protein AB3N02_13750 [Priestia aryabhattai]|uniref:hypothetical protein n=1 Tax=Priestia aryabhattai TaxID=412384 RepID=UPI00399FE208
MSELLVIGAVGSTVIIATLAEKKLVNTGKHIESDLIHNIVNMVLGGTFLVSFLWIAWKLVHMFILGV